MVEYHNKAFFGSKVGMFFESGSWTSPIFFLKLIRKRNNDTWEKPSKGEGKSIKFSLEEMVYMLRLLNNKDFNWNTYHTFEENKTQISFRWDKDNKEVLHVNGGDYYKRLNYAEIVVFKALLEHFFEEKIAHSTVNFKNGSSIKAVSGESNTKKSRLNVTEETIDNSGLEDRNTVQAIHQQVGKHQINDPETIKIKGECKGETEKALLIEFEGTGEIWIPKSTIRSNYDAGSDAKQQFTINTWVLIKNEVITKALIN